MMINLQSYATLTTQKKGTAGRAGGFERMTATVVFFAITVEHELSTLAKIRIAFCFVEISHCVYFFQILITYIFLSIG